MVQKNSLCTQTDMEWISFKSFIPLVENQQVLIHGKDAVCPTFFRNMLKNKSVIAHLESMNIKYSTSIDLGNNENSEEK